MPPEWTCNHCDFAVVAGTHRDLIRRICDHQRQAGGSLLLHESPDSDQAQDSCVRHLSANGSANTGVLIVTKSPALKLKAWRHNVGDWPQRLEILTPNMAAQLPAEDVVSDEDFVDGPLGVTELTSADLNGVAKEIDDILTDLDKSVDNLTVCIDNMTELINSFGTQPVFKFTHALNGRFRSLGAYVHWHYKPDTQIESSNHLFKQLFQLLHETRSEKSQFEVL